jgi:hypothetical protein
MLKGKRIIACLVCIFMLLPALVVADDATTLKKKIMFDQKKLIIMENMEFTAEEGEFFWPIFDNFQEELFQVSQSTAKLILAYASAYQTLTDEQAAHIIDEFYAVKKARLSILEKYTDKLVKGLPAKKVFRYLQVENKLHNIASYEISKEIPLAQ